MTQSIQLDAIQLHVGAQPRQQITDEVVTPETPLDQIADYVAERLSESAAIESSLGLWARKSTLAFYHAGHALTIARERLKESGHWVAWQDQHGLARTTVFEAITLYTAAEKLGGESKISGLPLTQAKRLCGVSGSGKPKKTTTKTRPVRAEDIPPPPPNRHSPTVAAQMALTQLMLVESALDDATDETAAVIQSITHLAQALTYRLERRAHVRNPNTTPETAPPPVPMAA